MFVFFLLSDSSLFYTLIKGHVGYAGAVDFALVLHIYSIKGKQEAEYFAELFANQPAC